MKITLDRRTFVKSLVVAGAGMSLAGPHVLANGKQPGETVPVGIIGLDTSHSPAFTRLINTPDEDSPELSGFQVIAAYPYGSHTIESSYSRIPHYTQEVQEMGVKIVDTIDELLTRVDMVLLLTNDGHPRLEQALQVLEAGKPMFMDKPIAASLEDTVAILEASTECSTPVFSSSSLRYTSSAQEIRHKSKIGDVLGVDAYSPSTIEPTHPDLFWYGIHGIEVLFTILGTGCQSVTRTKTATTDVVVGTWEDDRLGIFRGIRKGSSGYGGTAYGSEEILPLGSFEGYKSLVVEILKFYRTGVSPVELEETLELYAFMEAADESKRREGAAVTLDEVLSNARE